MNLSSWPGSRDTLSEPAAGYRRSYCLILSVISAICVSTGPSASFKPWRHGCQASLGEARRGRSRHTMAAGLRQSAHCVHRRRSQPDQEARERGSGSGLPAARPCGERSAGESQDRDARNGQLLRIHLVALAITVRDRPQLADVRHDHLMAELLKLFADPDRVNSGFHRHAGMLPNLAPIPRISVSSFGLGGGFTLGMTLPLDNTHGVEGSQCLECFCYDNRISPGCWRSADDWGNTRSDGWLSITGSPTGRDIGCDACSNASA